jgi:hypothetical protein
MGNGQIISGTHVYTTIYLHLIHRCFDMNVSVTFHLLTILFHLDVRGRKLWESREDCIIRSFIT